jgi:hypothetical protein
MFHRIFTKDVIRDLESADDVQDGVRSKDRVRDNAEVFTQPREVNAMLDLIDGGGPIAVTTTHLEPACGDGAFLTEIIRRKVAWARQEARTPKHLAALIIVALGSTYGIDISLRNVSDAKRRMLDIVRADLEVCGLPMVRLAEAVVSSNIVVGNFLRARGVMKRTPAWKKLKASERALVEFEHPSDEDILFIRIDLSNLEGMLFGVQPFTLRNMKLAGAEYMSVDEVDEHLWIIGESGFGEVELEE